MAAEYSLLPFAKTRKSVPIVASQYVTFGQFRSFELCRHQPGKFLQAIKWYSIGSFPNRVPLCRLIEEDSHARWRRLFMPMSLVQPR